MSQFTAPAGILGRPDFSGDDYTLQAFQNLSNTLGQLATTNAKREVEQAYEYGLMVEQLGAEEAKNASEFGKLVDQGKVSNLANSWIEVGGQVGRAKKDFISWSTMAEENMNLSLDSDQFGLRNGDNSEQAYTDWKASVLADQRQQMNGAGYYYGKTFGGLLDKWESEFKPKFLQTRAALQRADITDGLQFEILELSKKGRNALPNSLIDIQGKLQDTNLRGALGNNGVRDAVFEQLHLLSRDPKTAVFANTMLEKIKESSGTTLKRNYAKELAASKPQRDEALSKALADEFGDMAYTTISGYLDNNMETDFTSIVNAADPLLSEEDRNVQLLSAVQQAAFDLKEFEDVDGAVELIARLEQTETPDGSTYGEEMGRELARLRNNIENSQDRLLGSDLRKKRREEAAEIAKLAIANAAAKLQEQAAAGVIVSERTLKDLALAEFAGLTALDPDDPTIQATLNYEFQIGSDFRTAISNIGEDPRTLGADAYENAIKVGGSQGAAQLEAELETNQVSVEERLRARERYQQFQEDRTKARQRYEEPAKSQLRERMDEAGVPFDGKMPGDGSQDDPSPFLMTEAERIYNEAVAVLDERLTAKVNELQGSGLLAGEGSAYDQALQKVVDKFLEENTIDVMTKFDSYESISSRVQRALGQELPDPSTESSVEVPETKLDEGVLSFGRSFADAFANYEDEQTPENYRAVIEEANAFLKVKGVGGVQANEMGKDVQKAYAAARALGTTQPLNLEELRDGSFQANGVKLGKSNYNPRIQLFVSSRGELEALKSQRQTTPDINKTTLAQFVTAINKAAASGVLGVTPIEDIDEFIKFQEELLTRRGM